MRCLIQIISWYQFDIFFNSSWLTFGFMMKQPWEKQGQGSLACDLKSPPRESDVLRSEVQHDDGTNQVTESADGANQADSLLQAGVAAGSESPGVPDDAASSLE